VSRITLTIKEIKEDLREGLGGGGGGGKAK
jgi:hypothetical protein